jgi:hypothetical protein
MVLRDGDSNTFSTLPLLQFLYFWTIERFRARPKLTGGIIRRSALSAEAPTIPFDIFWLQICFHEQHPELIIRT